MFFRLFVAFRNVFKGPLVFDPTFCRSTGKISTASLFEMSYGFKYISPAGGSSGILRIPRYSPPLSLRGAGKTTSGMTTNEGTEAGRTNSDCTHTGVIRHPSKLPTAEAELGQTSGAVVGGRDIRDGTDVGDKRGDAWGRGMKDRGDGICGGFSAGRLRETN